MALRFPAFHTEHYESSVELVTLLSLVKAALRSLEWSLKSESSTVLIAHAGFSWLSWGERIEIRILEESKLIVTSRCRLLTQCFDWGSNESNVACFLNELHRAEQSEASDHIPLES